MANRALLAQLTQLTGQLNALKQSVGNLQASNTTLTTKIVTLEAEYTTLVAANMTLTAQVANLSGGAAAGGATGGGAGASVLVTFAATPTMVNHQDFIEYMT
jgi:cell division protein FtsB